MVTNGRTDESHGVNPTRTPGSTVPGVTRKGHNSVSKVTTDVPPHLNEIKKIVWGAEVECGYCDTRLGGVIKSYDHDGGIPVEGYTSKQWVYFPCPKCGYDWAFRKLLHQIQLKGEDF